VSKLDPKTLNIRFNARGTLSEVFGDGLNRSVCCFGLRFASCLPSRIESIPKGQA
jgi:hypothetical protein